MFMKLMKQKTKICYVNTLHRQSFYTYIYIYSTPIVAYAHTMFVTFCAMNVPASASCARPSILGTRVRSQGGIDVWPLYAGFWQTAPRGRVLAS